jgi:hypothetical protein
MKKNSSRFFSNRITHHQSKIAQDARLLSLNVPLEIQLISIIIGFLSLKVKYLHLRKEFHLMVIYFFPV